MKALLYSAALWTLASTGLMAAGALVSGTQTVAGSAKTSGTVTFTVLLTNSGADQPDNSGDEFSETLPAGLALVSASADSGNAVADVQGGQVTWNGAITAGATVTITFTATVTAPANTNLQARGTIAFDSGGTGTNDAATSTDDPYYPGAQDYTQIHIGTLTLTATQSFTGTAKGGQPLQFSVVLTNTGDRGLPDDPTIPEFTELLPTPLQIDSSSVSASSGTATGTDAGDEDGGSIAWDGALAPGAAVTITFTAKLTSGAASQTISAQGTAQYDADGLDGNEAALATDDPATAAVRDANTFTVPFALLIATQTVSGTFLPGSIALYTVVIKNIGTGDQPDNTAGVSGPHEFTESFPSGLPSLAVTATSGTIVSDLSSGDVKWDGSIAAGASVKLTIAFPTDASDSAGQDYAQQGIVYYDSDLSGNNDISSPTGIDTSGDNQVATGFTIRDGSTNNDQRLTASRLGFTFDPTANDFAQGVTLHVTSVQGATAGTTTLNSNGTVSYKATARLPLGGDSFTYTVSDGLGSSYTATVVVHDFADLAALFNGLVQSFPTPGAANASSGVLRVTTTASGLFTGTLTLAGVRFPLSGTLDSAGHALFGRTKTPTLSIKRKAPRGQPVPPELVLSLQVPYVTPFETATGVLTQAGNTFATVTADRNYYSAAAHPVAPLISVPTNLLGRYIVVFPPKSAPNRGLTGLQFPHGYGAGSLTVAKTGVVSIVATLADGSRCTASSYLNKNNDWPFYAGLYANGGSISGTAHLLFDANNGPAISGTNFPWFRPAMARAKTYAAGWPNGILVDFLGAP